MQTTEVVLVPVPSDPHTNIVRVDGCQQRKGYAEASVGGHTDSCVQASAMTVTLAFETGSCIVRTRPLMAHAAGAPAGRPRRTWPHHPSGEASGEVASRGTATTENLSLLWPLADAIRSNPRLVPCGHCAGGVGQKGAPARPSIRRIVMVPPGTLPVLILSLLFHGDFSTAGLVRAAAWPHARQVPRTRTRGLGALT
jgi:hypothetical protein